MKRTIIGCLASAMLLFALSGCTPGEQCGSWAYSGTPNPNSFSVSSAFTFAPADCGKNCTCDTDCMIQMVRAYNKDDRTFMYASDQPGAHIRATTNGWTIDRIGGNAYGYYSVNNDGVTFETWFNPPGKNNVVTTLYDGPGGWPHNTIFSAFDVVVCFRSAACQNKILGTYYWSFTTDDAGTYAPFVAAPGWLEIESQFQDALTGWNTWAPGSGPQNDGMVGQPVLPHAVVFPAMSDL